MTIYANNLTHTHTHTEREREREQTNKRNRMQNKPAAHENKIFEDLVLTCRHIINFSSNNTDNTQIS